jgi:hypothetical protein
MTEQINNQSKDSTVSLNPENKLIPQTKIESDEDSLKYDRIIVDKVKDALIKKDDHPSDYVLFLVEDFKPAFDLLEISQASSVQDVIDKMHSDNYDQESLDLKMNSFARAIFEIAQKDENMQEAVIAGPFSVENYILSGSPVTKGIGEKVVSFLTTNSELRYPMDFVDDCFNGFGRSIKHSYESLENTVNKAEKYVRHAKTSSLKDERARLDMLKFLDKKLRRLTDSSQEEINEKGYQRERLKFLEETINQNYEDAVNLTDNILTPKNFSEEEKKSEDKSVIPYTKKKGVYNDGYHRSADKINYTEFNTSALNQEGINISISLNIRENGSIELIQSKVKNNSDFPERISTIKFPLADTRGATQHFIDTYKGYLK